MPRGYCSKLRKNLLIFLLRICSSPAICIKGKQYSGAAAMDGGRRLQQSAAEASASSSPPPSNCGNEEEEALVALVDLRSEEVDRLREQIRCYESQLDVAVMKLKDTQSKLARLRANAASSSFSPLLPPSQLKVKERRIPSQQTPAGEPPQSHSRPPLIIPAVRPLRTPLTSADGRVPVKAGRSEAAGAVVASASVRASLPSDASINATRPFPSRPDAAAHREKRRASGAPSPERDRATKISKRKPDREHTNLISMVGKSSSTIPICIQSGTLMSSQHKRKLRCLEINNLDHHIFATSALNGVVNLWRLQSTGAAASLISSTDCLSPVQRRWPEDIAWHPSGDRLFAAYTADDADGQISVLNLNSPKKGTIFLAEKPHTKGIINKIQFMPTSDLCFATAGSDHSVILWKEKVNDGEWKPKRLHKDLHSSAVMGVNGLRQKNIILSTGVDKRVVAFDFVVNRVDFKHQMDSRCLSVLPNPADFNLVMVQTGSPGKQLRLFDVRMRWNKELHWLGWKQESSESQSALVNQDWSTDGLYLTSGSADPRIHIFDIRAGSHGPAQSVQAHQKRVFKAAWHPARPLIVSISSDLNIGLHTIL